MHHVHETYYNLPVGTEVRITGIDFICRVVEKVGGQLRVEYYWWFDHEWPSSLREEMVPFERYEFSYYRSPDNVTIDPGRDWSAVEQAYGIDHLGSSSPESRRQLAFRILKSD